MLRKIPLTGLYNTRISLSNNAAGASGIVGVGIVGIMIVGANNLSTDKDERYVNCMFLSRGVKADKSLAYYIIKRHGYATLNTPASGNVGSAIMVWTGKGIGQSVITAFGGTNSTIYEGITSLGAITGKCNGITETFVSTTPTLMMSSGNSTGWYYDTVSGLVQISDAQFPGNNSKTTTGTFAHMDGYAFIMDTEGSVWNSDLNTVTSWTALGYISANAYPDKGIGVVRYKNQIVAFGRESVQFFFNAGNATGSPLARVDSATLKIGAINSDAIAQISDVLFWVGSGPQGGATIYMFDGTVSRISTPEQDFQLLLAGPDNISLTTEKYYGRAFVVVKANATTFVYCMEEKKWHERTATTPLWYKSAGLSSGTQIFTYSISNVSTSGKVYVINPAALDFRDDGTAFTATIQTANDDMGTNNVKFHEELRVMADIESATSPLTVLYSDDDYATFVTHGTIDLSLGDRFRKLTRLGASVKRAWKFTHSVNTQFRISGFEEKVSAGKS